MYIVKVYPVQPKDFLDYKALVCDEVVCTTHYMQFLRKTKKGDNIQMFPHPMIGRIEMFMKKE